MFKLSDSSQCVTYFSMLFFRAISEFERRLSESPQYVERKLGILGRPADGDGRRFYPHSL